MKENTRKSNSDFKKSFQGLQDEAIVRLTRYKQNVLRDVNSSIAVFLASPCLSVISKKYITTVGCI